MATSTRSKTVSLPVELADRIDRYPRSELNLSATVSKLLARELDRRDKLAARRTEKDNA